MYENISKYVHSNYEMIRLFSPPVAPRRDAGYGLLILEVSKSYNDGMQLVTIRFL